MYITQVPSSWRSTRWASQIFSNRVRGLAGSTGGASVFLRNAIWDLPLAALGGAHAAFALRLFLLHLLAARPVQGLFRLLGQQLALGLGVLGDAARLAAQLAQVIELGAAHGALADDLDFPNVRAVERKHALDAFV